MRMLGLIGGMSWESSTLYYQLINRGVRDRLGGSHSAQCLLYSFDFAEIESLQRLGHWAEATRRLIAAAVGLEQAGCDGIIICTNTMHRLADEVQAAIGIPLLHIGDVTGDAVRADGLTTVGLLGTQYTMEAPFYRQRLSERFGLSVLVPDEADRLNLHTIIYEELVRGVVKEASRLAVEHMVKRLRASGAQGVILGCTEIELLLPSGSQPNLYPTAALHAQAAVDFILGVGHTAVQYAHLISNQSAGSARSYHDH
jgi:aspartate racemase